MAIASAPGKCHLIGEYSVVFGEPAILAAVGLRTTITAKKSDKISYKDSRFDHNNTFSLEDVKAATRETLDIWKKCAEQKNFLHLFESMKADGYNNYKKSVIGLALEKLGIDGGISVNIDSQIPAGAGIGSSASLAVAGGQAIGAGYGKHPT